jgi:hypothetical protein
VVVVTYFDKPIWKLQCAKLMTSLAHEQLPFVVGFINPQSAPSLLNLEACRTYVCKRQTMRMILKPMFVNEVLKSGLVGPDALVLAADCTDTFVACDADEMIRAFEAVRTPIVAGAERNWWPGSGLKQAVYEHAELNPYPPSPTPMRYSNGGLLAGRAHALRQFFETWEREWRVGEEQYDWCCPDGIDYLRAEWNVSASSLTPSAAEPAAPSQARGRAEVRRRLEAAPLPLISRPLSQERVRFCFDDQHCMHSYVAARFWETGKGPSLSADTRASLFLTMSGLETIRRMSIVSARGQPRGPGRYRIELNTSETAPGDREAKAWLEAVARSISRLSARSRLLKRQLRLRSSAGARSKRRLALEPAAARPLTRAQRFFPSRWRADESGSGAVAMPCFVHGAGPAKSAFHPLLKMLAFQRMVDGLQVRLGLPLEPSVRLP